MTIAVPPRPASPHRLAIVLSHPNQYYSPWFRWLSAHRAVALRVFYLWEFGVTARLDPQFQQTIQWDVDLLSGYEHEFVPNTAKHPSSLHFRGLRNPQLTARLAAWRPTAVLLFGYKWDSHLRALCWARLHRLPLLFRGDSHFLGRGAPNFLRRLALRCLYAQFSACLPVGAANRDYFTTLGVPARRLFPTPHCVNHELYDPASPEHLEAAAALRTRLRLAPETKVILFAGKFVEWKQPRELLEAFLQLQPPGWSLVFVGDGEEKAALTTLAQSAPAGAVHFLPFANQTEMPARYLLADLFVLPSRGLYETWGLAINEAMHLGVPALVSDLVGCQRDLITEGETGWVFRAFVAHDLRTKLALALSALGEPDARARFRDAVQDRIARYTYRQATDGLLAALASLPVPRTPSAPLSSIK